MSRDPWDLAQAMSRRMNRLNVPHRADADPLLAWASWQLNAAQFGFDIYQRALPLGDANGTGHPLHTVEIAALNLVFRGVVSAMDQCAGAVARLTGQMTRATRERDVGWWFEPRNKAAWRGLPPRLAKWLAGFDGDPTWTLASELRHALTHRWTRRDVVVGGAVQTYLHVGGVIHPAPESMRKVLNWGRGRYSAFERALAKTYPLR